MVDLYSYQNQLVRLSRITPLTWGCINYTNGKAYIFGLVGNQIQENGGLAFCRLLPPGTMCSPCQLLPEDYRVDFDIRPITPEESSFIKECIRHGHQLERYNKIPRSVHAQLFDEIPILPCPIFNNTLWTRSN